MSLGKTTLRSVGDEQSLKGLAPQSRSGIATPAGNMRLPSEAMLPHPQLSHEVQVPVPAMARAAKERGPVSCGRPSLAEKGCGFALVLRSEEATVSYLPAR